MSKKLVIVVDDEALDATLLRVVGLTDAEDDLQRLALKRFRNALLFSAQAWLETEDAGVRVRKNRMGTHGAVLPPTSAGEVVANHLV